MFEGPVTLNSLGVGQHWVITATGSEYELDLDEMVVTRRRVIRLPEDELRRDDERVALLDLVNCTVGEDMIMVLDLGLHEQGVPYTVRTTSQVIAVLHEKLIDVITDSEEEP